MKKTYSPAEEFAGTPQMETMYHLTKERMQDAGISFEFYPNGAVEIRGIVSPMQYFEEAFVKQIINEHGDRTASIVLDKVGAAMTSELFVLRFRKMLD